jgi:DNA-binding MarR family transcriptional regulator
MIGPTQLRATRPLTATRPPEVAELPEPQPAAHSAKSVAATATITGEPVPTLDCTGRCLYPVVMTDGTDGVESWPFPALLRGARRAYRAAIRGDLEDAGCDDIPRNGIFVIGAIARTEAPLSEIIEQLGASKQAAGALVDTLVTRGYLDRTIDPEDRRRLRVKLTERGEAAAAVVRAAVERVDAALEARVGPEQVAQTRATLASLITGDTADA